MNRPILTIGIPTYNHAKSLRLCLAAVTDQFIDKDVFGQVEIFISDNGSQDDTHAVVEEYQKRFPNIRYSRNEINLKFDRNVDAVLRNANGSFCWTLSSNEYLEPGSIAYVLSVIRQYPDIAYICVSNQKEDKGKTDIRHFDDGNQWLKEMGVFGGQISQCIFNMDHVIPDRTKYYDNFWLHLSLFWETVAHCPIILLPCLFVLPDIDPVCGWARDEGGGQTFRTYIALAKIVTDLPQYGYDERIVDGVVLGLAKGLPRAVASAKLYGLPIAWDRFSLLAAEFYRYPLYLLVSTIIFLTPTPLLRFVKKIT